MKGQNGKGSSEQNARGELLSAGIALFAEKGYASTSVREIVALAGVTKPVLYYYFQSKEGLFRAILDWAAEQQEALLAHVLETPGTAMDRTIHLYNLIYQGVMENQSLFKLVHNLVFGPPQGRPPYDLERYHRVMVDAIRAIYLEGLERGELREANPEEVAFLVIGLTDFCFHLDYLHPESMDSGRPERLLRLAFRGLVQRNDDKDAIH